MTDDFIAISDFGDCNSADDISRARRELLDWADRLHAHHVATGEDSVADWQQWRGELADAITRRAIVLGLESE